MLEEIKSKKKYMVTVTRTGCLFVEANSPEEAMDIANHQETKTVSWTDDWQATDVIEDDSALPGSYITHKAFDFICPGEEE